MNQNHIEVQLRTTIATNDSLISSLVISDGADFLVTGSADGMITLYALELVRVVSSLRVSMHAITAIRINADHTRIAAVADDLLHLIEMTHDGLREAEIDPPVAVRSSDWKMDFASGQSNRLLIGVDNETVSLFNLVEKKIVTSICVHEQRYECIHAASLSSDGNHLLVATDRIKVFNLASGECTTSNEILPDESIQFHNGRFIPIPSRSFPIRRAAFHPDDCSLLCTTDAQFANILFIRRQGREDQRSDLRVMPDAILGAYDGIALLKFKKHFQLLQDGLTLAEFDSGDGDIHAFALSADASHIVVAKEGNSSLNVYATGLCAHARAGIILPEEKEVSSDSEILKKTKPGTVSKKQMRNFLHRFIDESNDRGGAVLDEIYALSRKGMRLHHYPIFWSRDILLPGSVIYLYYCGRIHVTEECYFIWIDLVPPFGDDLAMWVHPVLFFLVPANLAIERTDVKNLRCGGPFCIRNLIEFSGEYRMRGWRKRAYMLSNFHYWRKPISTLFELSYSIRMRWKKYYAAAKRSGWI